MKHCNGFFAAIIIVFFVSTANAKSWCQSIKDTFWSTAEQNKKTTRKKSKKNKNARQQTSSVNSDLQTMATDPKHASVTDANAATKSLPKDLAEDEVIQFNLEKTGGLAELTDTHKSDELPLNIKAALRTILAPLYDAIDDEMVQFEETVNNRNEELAVITATIISRLHAGGYQEQAARLQHLADDLISQDIATRSALENYEINIENQLDRTLETMINTIHPQETRLSEEVLTHLEPIIEQLQELHTMIMTEQKRHAKAIDHALAECETAEKLLATALE